MKSQNKTYRPAVFLVTYRINKETKLQEYLLLKRKLHWRGWEFPKGGIEKNENLFAAAKREFKEETNLKAIKIKKFNVSGKFKYNKILSDRPGYIGQTYQLFSVEVKAGRVKLDKKEHSTYVWLPYEKAIKKLTYKTQKKCLRIVNNYLGKAS